MCDNREGVSGSKLDPITAMDLAAIHVEIRALKVLVGVDRAALCALADHLAASETALSSRLTTVVSMVEAYREEIRGLTRWLI